MLGTAGSWWQKFPKTMLSGGAGGYGYVIHKKITACSFPTSTPHNVDEGVGGEKKNNPEKQRKSKGAAPPLSLKNLSPLAWIFSAKGRSCSRGRGLGAWGRHLMVPELALRRARKNLVFLRRAAPGKKIRYFLRRAAPGKKIRCFFAARSAGEKSGVFAARSAGK